MEIANPANHLEALTNVRLRETGLPPFMVGVNTLSNSHKSGAIKVMVFAELPDASNCIYSSVGISNNNGLPAAGFCRFDASTLLGSCLCTLNTSNVCKTNLLYRFWCMLGTAIMSWLALNGAICTHLGSCFGGVFYSESSSVAKLGNAVLFPGFRRLFSPNKPRHRLPFSHCAQFGSGLRRFFFTSLRIGNLLFCLRRELSSKSGTSGGGHVESVITEGLQLINPVLLTCCQKLRDQYQFQYFKDEGLCPVLIPCALQFLVAMISTPKTTAMFQPTLMQVNGTTNIDLSGGSASNAVNTRRFGDIRGHILNGLSLSALFLRCQGGKASTFSRLMISQMLGNSSIIAFCGRGKKVEEFKAKLS